MQFLNPIFLLSALAIAIPIALHFWHQKKGKILDWAAMQWLSDKDLQLSKGLKFEELLLLLLRCLLILILTFWLSRMLIKGFKSDSNSKIHLVQQSKNVVNTFRFELETAIKNKEKIYLINDKTQQINDLNIDENHNILNDINLQKSFNDISQFIDNETIELYFINHKSFFTQNEIYVPAVFNLHFINDSSKNKNDYICLENNKKLGINSKGILSVDASFNGKEIHKGVINVLINLDDKLEQKTMIAAFEAIKKVYLLSFNIDFESIKSKKYDVIIGQINQNNYSNNALVLETSNNFFFDAPNLIHLENALSPLNSEAVFEGQLPEIILNHILDYYKISADNQLFSENEIKNKFKERKDFKPKKESTNQLLILIFILVLIFERYLALKKK